VRGLLGRREIGRAESELAPLLKEYPQVAIVQVLNGTLKLLQNDVPGARMAYERAIGLSPDLTEALAGLIGVDLLQNRVAQAKERIEARLQAAPKRVEFLMLAAQVYGKERDFAKAEAALRNAIQVDPASSRAYSMLASVLLASGKLDAARLEFDQIAQREPKNVAVQTMAAMIVHAQNKIPEAKKRYEAIVGADPAAAVAANNLAWIYADEGEKLDEALRLAQGAALRLPDSGEVQDTLGWIYYKKELPGLAVPAFEKSIEKAPENPAYHYHLALALSKAGETQRARLAAEQAVKLKPDYAEAQKLLSQTKG
jgi:predicted Zn-dependent protease